MGEGLLNKLRMGVGQIYFWHCLSVYDVQIVDVNSIAEKIFSLYFYVNNFILIIFPSEIYNP